MCRSVTFAGALFLFAAIVALPASAEEEDSHAGHAHGSEPPPGDPRFGPAPGDPRFGPAPGDPRFGPAAGDRRFGPGDFGEQPGLSSSGSKPPEAKATALERFAQRLAKILDERDVDALTVAESTHWFRRVFESATRGPRTRTDELRRRYQERILDLRARLEAEGASSNDMERALEGSRAAFESWRARFEKPVALPPERSD